jgi:hypothetical protein
VTIPSVKGSVFIAIVEDVHKLLAANRVKREELGRWLQPKDLSLLDSPILAHEWYDVRVYARLSELLGKPVPLAPDCVGPEVEAMACALQPGEVLLLENLRFHPEEEKNDPAFARRLAKLGEIYVNDAFGTAHRAHASTEGVAHLLHPAVAGRLMQRELEYLGRALDDPSEKILRHFAQKNRLLLFVVLFVMFEVFAASVYSVSGNLLLIAIVEALPATRQLEACTVTDWNECTERPLPGSRMWQWRMPSTSMKRS